MLIENYITSRTCINLALHSTKNKILGDALSWKFDEHMSCMKSKMKYFHFSSDFCIYHHVFIGILMIFSQCIVCIFINNYTINYSDIFYLIKLIFTISVISVSSINIFILIRPNKIVHLTLFTMGEIFNHFFYIFGYFAIF